MSEQTDGTVASERMRYVIDAAGASDSIPDYEDPDAIPDEEDEDFDEAEDELAGSEIIRAKWSMDGADTLAVAAVNLRAFAAHLDALEAEGWQLRAPVEDDYGFIVKGEAKP